MILTIVMLFIAYLLGSVNCAILISRFLKLDDPRQHGSGNPGATNILRTGHNVAAIITLFGDALKGFIAVMLARLLGIDGVALALVALAAFVGHLYPIFFSFKGGKGVATMFGVLLALHLLLGLLAIAVWLVVAFIFRYSSLAAIVAAISAPIDTLQLANPNFFLPLVVLAILVIFRHRANIDRLRHSQEPRFNFKRSKNAPPPTHK